MLLDVAENVVAPRDGVLTPPMLYAGTQNLGSSACGSTEHAVSGIGELGGSFRAGTGLFALGLVDGESHAS